MLYLNFFDRIQRIYNIHLLSKNNESIFDYLYVNISDPDLSEMKST